MTYSRATGSENYRLPSVAGSGVLPVTEKSAVPIPNGKKPASNPGLTTGSPVTENYRFRNRSAASSGVLLVTEKSAVPILTGKEPVSNLVLTTVSRLQSIDGDKLVGQEVSSVNSFNQPVSEPTDRVPAYTTFSDSCFTRTRDTGEVIRFRPVLPQFFGYRAFSQKFWLQRDTSLPV